MYAYSYNRAGVYIGGWVHPLVCVQYVGGMLMYLHFVSSVSK